MAIVNHIFSAVMIVLALCFYLLGNTLSDDAAKWPQFFSILLIILSIGLIIDTIIKPNRESETSITEKQKIDQKDKNHNLTYTGILTILYLLLMNFIGFLILTPIYIFGLLWLLTYREVKKLIFLSIGTTIGITALFQYLLGVPIPQGFLENLL
ncbi:tripartite tricarboxylate transporter TctB family protein [Metabacillus niabensis]|uniref:tripartite tricarboxylate transporter TctB family protein n=1 Tax=Metabacillus niabensis TaxID=324854 RepID=UPI001CFA8136|nr:tripartite tricarboxylate transporter TctB family protein [Metabacillus niabensis]